MLPKNHRDLYRKTLAFSELCILPNDASQLTFSILNLWWANLYPSLTADVTSNKFLQNASVQFYADSLAKMPFIEAAFWLSCGYALWVGSEERKSKAMFFTPPRLAEHVIDTLLANGAKLEAHKWFDPACGGAAFIAPLAIRIRDYLRASGSTSAEILNIIEQNILGIDVDFTLQKLSSMYVRAVVYDESKEVGREIFPNIKNANTLELSPKMLPEFDVLICNPPYRKLTSVDRSGISAEYLSQTEGQHNLYGIFISAAINASREKSLLALLTPTSYMSGRHFTKLRKQITNSLEVLTIDILMDSDNTFVQVEQGTAILYAKSSKEKKRKKFPVRVLSNKEDTKVLGDIDLNPDGDPWYIPRTSREYSAYKNTSGSTFRLKDYGYIAKIGPLVWNRDPRKKLFSAEDVEAAQAPVPVIWSSNITSNGLFEFGRIASQKNYFGFIEARDGKANGVVREECVVLQRVTSADQAKRLVGAVVPQDFFVQYGCFIAENHVVTILPIAPKISPSQMVEMLMTEHIDSLFRCISGTVGVTVYELGKLPLPDPKNLKMLLDVGMSMHQAVKMAFETFTSAQEKKDGA